MDLKQLEAELTQTLNLKGQGADEERARIVWYLRKDAENSIHADVLTDYAGYIAAGFHWDMPEEEEAAFEAELAAEEAEDSAQ